MDPISQTTLSNARIFIEIDWSLFLRSNYKYSGIGWDNGLAPSRRQAIISTNDVLFTDAYMRHLASMN